MPHPMQWFHLFGFKDEAAQQQHGESAAVAKFESVYSPELVGGEVVFTDYVMVSGKMPAH